MKKLEELGISPAPWKVKKEDGGYYVANSDCTGVCSLVRYYSNIERIEADTRLIAAAPELYGALLDALPWLADIGAEVVGNECAEKIAAVVAKAEAALRKAVGESEMSR